MTVMLSQELGSIVAFCVSGICRFILWKNEIPSEEWKQRLTGNRFFLDFCGVSIEHVRSGDRLPAIFPNSPVLSEGRFSLTIEDLGLIRLQLPGEALLGGRIALSGQSAEICSRMLTGITEKIPEVFAQHLALLPGRLLVTARFRVGRDQVLPSDVDWRELHQIVLDLAVKPELKKPVVVHGAFPALQRPDSWCFNRAGHSLTSTSVRGNEPPRVSMLLRD